MSQIQDNPRVFQPLQTREAQVQTPPATPPTAPPQPVPQAPSLASQLSPLSLAGSAAPSLSLFASDATPAQGASDHSLPQEWEQLFQRIDRSDNGWLTSGELNKALHSRSFTGGDAAKVAALYKHRSEMAGFTNDEWGPESQISRQDIRKFLEAGSGNKDAVTIHSLVGWGQGKIRGTNKTPFPNGVDSIRPDNIKQGMIGDCYFLAAVGTQAQTPQGRQAIHDMIHPQRNGKYTVNFPGQNPVTINAPTDAEIALYSGAGEDGLWLSILEKAYAQLESDNNWVWSYDNQYDEVGSGNFLSSGISAMTGHSTDTDMLSLTANETTHQKLRTALANGRLVTAGIRGNMPFTTPRTDNGLPMGHAYSVLDYNPNSRQVTLRNPWGSTGGNSDADNDGTFRMSLSEFASTFTMVTYEQAE